MKKIIEIGKKYINWMQKTFHIPDKIMQRSVKVIWAFIILKTMFWIVFYGIIIYHFFIE